MFSDIPREIDDWIYFQLLIIFVIGFCINVYGDARATMIFMNNTYGIVPNEDTNFSLYRPEMAQIQTFTNSIYIRSVYARWTAIILYFVVSPLINFYFAIFKFKRGRLWTPSFPVEM